MKNSFVKIIEGKIYNFERIDQGGIAYKVIFGRDLHDYVLLKKDEPGMWKIQTDGNTPTYIKLIAEQLSDAIEFQDDDE